MLIYVSDVLLVALGLSKINDIKYFFSWISFQAWSFQERKADSFCKWSKNTNILCSSAQVFSVSRRIFIAFWWLEVYKAYHLLLVQHSRYTRLIIVVQHYSHFLNSVWICKFLQVLRETLKKMYWLYVAGIPVRRGLFRLSRFLCATLSLCGFMPFGCSGPSNWNNTLLWVHFMRMMELIYILDSDLHGSN